MQVLSNCMHPNDWTRRVEGKTKTIRLTEDQDSIIEEWVSNTRRVEKIIMEMKNMSVQAAEKKIKNRVLESAECKLKASKINIIIPIYYSSSSLRLACTIIEPDHHDNNII